MIDPRRLRTPVMLVLHPRVLSPKQRMGSNIWLSIRGFLLHSLYQSQRHWRPGTDWDALANINYFKAKPVNIPKITILVDHGYHPETISQALQEIYPQILTKIRFERPKTFKAEKAQGKFDLFQLRPDGWLNARMLDGTLQESVENFEWTLAMLGKLNLCFIRLMLKRLAEA